MAAYSVLYDACVLYPAPLRDLLLRLAMVDLLRARCPGLVVCKLVVLHRVWPIACGLVH